MVRLVDAQGVACCAPMGMQHATNDATAQQATQRKCNSNGGMKKSSDGTASPHAVIGQIDSDPCVPATIPGKLNAEAQQLAQQQCNTDATNDPVADAPLLHARHWLLQFPDRTLEVFFAPAIPRPEVLSLYPAAIAAEVLPEHLEGESQ